MATRSRIRRHFDTGRLRRAIAGPGADPRSWLFTARVDTDEDAVRWEADYGWIADVTVTGGELDGEGPIPCRVPVPFVDSGQGSSAPIKGGALVAVLLTEADLNGFASIVGFYWTPDIKPPTTVNNETVDEQFGEGAIWAKSSADLSLELGSAITVSSDDEIEVTTTTLTLEGTQTANLIGQAVNLAETNATQPFVKGNAQFTALQNALQAITTYANTLAKATPAPPNAALTVAAALAAFTPLQIALTQAITDLQGALSTRIKGE